MKQVAHQELRMTGHGQDLRISLAKEHRGGTRTCAAAALLIVLLVTTGCFRQSSHTRAVREGVLAAAGEGWQPEVELGVGALTFGLVRSGAMFLDLPPEAKTALRSLRGADVGVYKYYGVDGRQTGKAFLSGVDAKLVEQGWQRMVGVIDKDDTVGIYVPQEIRSTGYLRLYVVVMSHSELVIVSARGNPEPLIALAFEKAREEIELAEVR